VVCPTSMTPIRFEFLMDDTYFCEFHRQWVAVLGKGWRTSKRMAIALISTSVLAATLGWSEELPALTALAVSFAVFGLLVTVTMARRRTTWLKHCRSLPWYGKFIRIEVRDGDLVQVKDYPGDPTFQRTGAVVVTPNGYLVRYRGLQKNSNPVVSSTDASVYLPHRTISPSMTRETFLSSFRLEITSDAFFSAEERRSASAEYHSETEALLRDTLKKEWQTTHGDKTVEVGQGGISNGKQLDTGEINSGLRKHDRPDAARGTGLLLVCCCIV
jgi:hypothetical protein